MEYSVTSKIWLPSSTNAFLNRYGGSLSLPEYFKANVLGCSAHSLVRVSLSRLHGCNRSSTLNSTRKRLLGSYCYFFLLSLTAIAQRNCPLGYCSLCIYLNGLTVSWKIKLISVAFFASPDFAMCIIWS